MTENLDTYTTDDAHGDGWHIMLGDSCERLGEIPDNSIGLSVYSPPFASLFTYSPSMRDLGNSASRQEFLDHYRFIIDHLLRVTMPGRITCVHVQQLTTTKATHGYTGLTDFRGEVIRAYLAAGWHFHGEVTVDKDPQALRHGQRVLTPTGWTAIENLAVGDQVIGAGGEATKVVGVWPQGVGQIYRVSFSDGVTVDCDAAHLWSVQSAADGRHNRWRAVRTEALLADGVLSPSGRPRYEVPLVGPVHYDVAPDLPLHPYVLGALLGDGNVTQRSGVSFCTQRAIAHRVAALLPAGHTVREQNGTSKGDDCAVFHIGHPQWHRNDVLDTLRTLGVQGSRAWEKRVPADYMTASVEDRRSLLTGLLDTDGTVKIRGSVWFGTTSGGLADDVVALVQSLGGIARRRIDMSRRYQHNGENREGRPMHMVCIEIDGEPLVTLPHKVLRWRTARRRWARHITAIKPVGSDERTCITVAADDGLFVTEGFVVTHNSQAIRTKAQALMFVTKNRDSSATRPALADYLLLFRKPGDNAIPIKNDVSNEEWIEWARPVWLDIKETNTLNTRVARDSADERHIAALQLDFVERCVRLWSNRGERVLTPFAGIGTEVYVARKLGRYGIGCELKESYFRTAVRNLRDLDAQMEHPTLLDLA
jgi:hypothetical protein